MVDPNMSMEQVTKFQNQEGDRHYYKVSKPNRGSVHFKIFHQNIKGLAMKSDELLCHLLPYAPHAPTWRQ